MKRIAPVTLIACLAAAALFAGEAEPDGLFEVQRLTDRVLIFKERSPWESNHVVIVGERGLVLVDPGHSALMARLLRTAIAEELGRDRIAWVVDTHGHWGHTWGSSGFPEAIVVGHDEAVREIEAGRPQRARQIEFMQRQLAAAESELDGLDPASDEAAAARLRHDHLARLVRGLSEDGFVVETPQLTFSDRLRLDLGDLTLEMVFLGRGHSGSDIAVLIPEEKILLLGCFFLEQGPLPVYGTQPALDPERWLEVFDGLLEDPSAIEHVVLGQHSVWPRERLAAARDAIARLWSEVQALDAEGVSLEEAIDRLPPGEDLDRLREAGATDEQLAQYQRFEVTALMRQLKTPAATEVERAIAEGGIEAGLARYRELSAGDDPEVFFDETAFNLLGYKLLGEDRVDDAISVFQLNVDRFPESWNVYDSLGEAYAAKGETRRAIELYRRSVEINPDNANGVQALEQLGATPEIDAD